MKLYFISGMGADERVFSYLRLPEGYEPVYIHWIEPLKDESLACYALRLAEQIDTSERFILAGVSLGGMLASEIAKRFPPLCTILISSIPLSGHLPKYYRVAAALRLGRIIPAPVLKGAAIVKYSLFMREVRYRRLMRQIIRDSDDRMIHWSLNAVLAWKNDIAPSPLYHIHGSHDETLPCRFTRPTHIIKKGGHMLVVNHADTVNQFLREILPTQTR